MNPAEDEFSESDQSDEDFCPQAKDHDAGDSDTGSEEDSDDEVSDGDQTVEHQRKDAVRTENKTNRKSGNNSLGEQENRKYSTRQANGGISNNKSRIEKDALESDEEEKSKTDALWADFLSDVKAVPKGKPETVSQTRSPAKTVNDISTNSVHEKPKEERQSSENTQSKKSTVTEAVDIADKEVNEEKLNKNNGLKTHDQSPILSKGYKRAIPAGSGLNSILNQIGKKKKISVLEKSQHDWNSFKETEGITNELKTHNKGKDGYLERQDFLERTDLRQFEIERNLRQSKRNN